ncbi:MAG TPA: hypothetical protein VFS08_08500 [Gemmatimonadaceae bacterium]|nr:hypothetical protein [Gemmatimonadaceae bacterium]
MRRTLLFGCGLATLLSCDAATVTSPPSFDDEPRAALTASRSAVFSFAALAPGDIVDVYWHATGCFHDEEYRLLFERTETGARISGGPIGATDASPQLAFQRPVRPHSVTTADLERLDRLLALFRASPGGGCTEQREIRLTAYRTGSPVVRDAYESSDCSWLEVSDGRVEWRQDVATIFELVWPELFSGVRDQ